LGLGPRPFGAELCGAGRGWCPLDAEGLWFPAHGGDLISLPGGQPVWVEEVGQVLPCSWGGMGPERGRAKEALGVGGGGTGGGDLSWPGGCCFGWSNGPPRSPTPARAQGEAVFTGFSRTVYAEGRGIGRGRA
jgi:hypothetical protein